MNRHETAIRLMGGLGNQLFQYALGRALEEKVLGKSIITFDKSWFYTKGERIYMLDKFNTKVNDSSFKKPIEKKFWGLFNKKSNEPFLIKEGNYSYKYQNNLITKYLKLSDKRDVYIEGYWQNEKYFNEIGDLLQREIILKNPFSDVALNILNNIGKDSVSVHIRRGDYVTNPKYQVVHDVCNQEYYEKALKYISSKITEPKFYIFSDDIDWAKNNKIFNIPNTTFVSRPTLKAEEELLIMKECNHQIIANSSFSWWAAWLNKNPNKIVIAPSLWINKPRIESKDILPQLWIKI
jgi:hypothetical protein